MSLAVASIFIIFGILIKYFKMYFLIAGLNTMSHKQRAQYDLEKIGTLFRNVMFTMAILLTVGYFLSRWLQMPVVEYTIFFCTVIGGCIYLITKANSKKYKKFESD